MNFEVNMNRRLAQFLLSLAGVLVTLFFTGCAAPKPPAASPALAAPIAKVEEATPPPKDTPPEKPTLTEAVPQPAEPRVLKSIYFAFDSSVIDDANLISLKERAEDLKQRQPKAIVLEGNTDERGSNEYNLALGERRAQAVKRSLTTLGVTNTDLKTISFGEEKPASPGQNEESWAQNRRVDFNETSK